MICGHYEKHFEKTDGEGNCRCMCGCCFDVPNEMRNYPPWKVMEVLNDENNII
jgi:hypothetical protein